MIELKQDVNRKKVSKNENQNKIVDVVEKVLNFDKQPKDKGLLSDLTCVAHVGNVSDHFDLKMLTPRQMLQRLTTDLAQVKAGNTSENLLNEMRQIIYSFY